MQFLRYYRASLIYLFNVDIISLKIIDATARSDGIIFRLLRPLPVVLLGSDTCQPLPIPGNAAFHMIDCTLGTSASMAKINHELRLQIVKFKNAAKLTHKI
jgi:hypothetical protein